ncbi:hypothetical protein [Halorussus salinisoli]|nr:hypothetical protein [Halorussus salinisoli]
MSDHLETRVRLVGAGIQTSLFGLAVVEFDSVGFALVFFGAAITLGGVI